MTSDIVIPPTASGISGAVIAQSSADVDIFLAICYSAYDFLRSRR